MGSGPTTATWKRRKNVPANTAPSDCTPTMTNESVPQIPPLDVPVQDILTFILKHSHSNYSQNPTDDPIDVNIPYHPASELISYNWDSAQSVLTHLILHPEERHDLIHEAHQRSPHQPTNFTIQHPLLPSGLQVNSFDIDYLFLATLHSFQEKLEDSPREISKTQIPSTPPPTPPVTPDTLPNPPYTEPETSIPSPACPSPHTIASPDPPYVPCQFMILASGMTLVPLYTSQHPPAYPS